MENKVFEQLMLADGRQETLSVEQENFITTHRRIISCGNAAGRAFIDLARELQRMRDGKLYVAAGFADFGEYVEQAVGLKQRQAYNYIKVAERFTDKYLEEHAGYGVTKLALLASISETEREGVEENMDVEGATTRELEARIRELEAERDEKQAQLSLFEASSGSAEQAKRKAMSMQAEAEKKIADAEKLKKKLLKLGEEKTALEKQVQDLKNLPPEVKEVENPETAAKLKAAEKARDEAVAAYESARKQLEIASDESMMRFKVKFEDFQNILGEMFAIMTGMEQEKTEKCVNALKVVLRERGL